MEIVLRSSVIFFFIWILLRALGKRELTQLTAFELVLIIVMGDLVQQGVTQEDFSVTGNMLGVATIGVWILMTSYTSYRWPRLRAVTEGLPTIVLREGKVSEEALRIERVTVEELLEAARQENVRDLDDIEIGILERDGKFTFVMKNSSK